MLSKTFDIQKFLRSLKEFDAIPASSASYSREQPQQVESKLLDKNKRIKVSLSRIFSQILSEISNYSIAMNSSISDVSIGNDFIIDGDERFTPSTWGGRGDKINQDIQACLSSIADLVNPNVSTFSHFNFSNEISSIIYSELFGRQLDSETFLYSEGGINYFGKLNKLFGFEVESIVWQFSGDGINWIDEKVSPIFNVTQDYFNKITDTQYRNSFTLKVRSVTTYSNTSNKYIQLYPQESLVRGAILAPTDYLSGLSFLEPFSKINSYTRDIYQEYKDGIEFIPPDLFSLSSSYSESFSDGAQIISNYSMSLADKVNNIKILLDNIYYNCDEFGRYAGYEGLGNIKGQIGNLRKVFKPEYLYLLVDGINSDLLKITSFSNSGSQEIITNLFNSIRKVSSYLDSLCTSLSRIGIKIGDKIVDRSYIYGANTRDEIVSQLKKLGLNSQQINTVLSSKDLSCSFVFLYDELDEKDIYSYFKGGRLAEYIFYLGGEQAISQTLNFLISKDNIQYFLNILDKLQKNRDYTLSKNRYIYGNILGSFISIFPEAINYLVGPDYKKYQVEIITQLITSGQITKTSFELLDSVSKKISDSAQDINFDQALSHSIIVKQFIDLLSPALNDLLPQYKNQNFLGSINGLSAKELNILLNKTGGRRTYELSGFLAGIEGGRYQSLISGFIHAVLLPKTSPALLPANRRSFTLGANIENVSLEELVFSIKNFSSDLNNLSNLLIDISSGVISNQNSEPQLIKSTVYSINKDISYTIGNLSNQNNPDFISQLKSSLDSLKPGVGNSPSIDSSQKRGVLTPPQSRELEFLLGKSQSSTQPIQNQVLYDEKFFTQKELLSRWIKLDFSSLNSLDGVYKVEKGIDYSDNPTRVEFESIKDKLTQLISDGFINSQKSNYFNIVNSVTSNKSVIDPVSICTKLGKSLGNCQKEYSTPNSISSNFGNTLYPSSIPIERPLGTLSEAYSTYSNAPGPKLLESLSNGKLNASDLDLPATTGYNSVIDVLPSISFQKNINSSEVLNQEERKISAGLFDLSNNHLYIEKYSKNSKERISDCRLITDPIERQLCINFIKCIKFKPSSGNDYLNYCPVSTPGGKNKIYAI